MDNDVPIKQPEKRNNGFDLKVESSAWLSKSRCETSFKVQEKSSFFFVTNIKIIYHLRHLNTLRKKIIYCRRKRKIDVSGINKTL